MKLESTIKKYQYISFDIFDTLLKRDVLIPTDVFELVEKSITKLHSDRFAGFKKKRIEAEKNARKESHYDDVTLDEIYDQIEYSEEDRHLLKKVELEMEKKVIHENQRMKDLYEACKSGGKVIYLVSDMYLPKDFIEDVLHLEGYTGYKKLFLSSEYRKTKKSAALFRILCQEERIMPDKILHIGDSRVADCFGAFRAGVKFSHVRREEHDTLYFDKPGPEDSLDKKVLFSFINNRETGLATREMRLGYEVLGPVIYGYCQWLHEKIKNGKVRVWFVARDMYLFYQAYRMIYGVEKNVEYIYLSRKSLRPLYTDVVGDLTKSGDVFSGEKYSISQILEYMGYSLGDIHLADDVDVLSPKYDARKLGEIKEIQEIFDNPSISIAERKLSKAAYAYFDQHGFFSNDIVLADIGWHGTTQYILSVIQSNFSDNYNIRGYYLGCMDGTEDRIGKENYETFLFDEHDNCMFKNGTLLFESIVLAPYGSTIRYEQELNETRPVLSEAGTVPQTVFDIQQGALQFINDMRQNQLTNDITLQSNVKQMFEKMTASPQEQELRSLGEIEYENISHHKLAAPESFGFYFLHPKQFMSDFYYAPWRIGFLKRLFRIPFQYDKLVSMIKKLYFNVKNSNNR